MTLLRLSVQAAQRVASPSRTRFTVFPIDLRRSASAGEQSTPKAAPPIAVFPRCGLQAAGTGGDSDGSTPPPKFTVPKAGSRLLPNGLPSGGKKVVSGMMETADDGAPARKPTPFEAAGGNGLAGALHVSGMWTLTKVLQPGELRLTVIIKTYWHRFPPRKSVGSVSICSRLSNNQLPGGRNIMGRVHTVS